MSKADLQALVDVLVRDKDQVIASASRDNAITQAVLRYSADRPREVTIDVVALAGYELDLPMGWDPVLSTLRVIEYPVDQVPASEVDTASVRFRKRPDADVVLAFPFAFPAGASVRLTYTQQHVVDDTTDTIPAVHRNAIACLAASMLCGQLASYYATEGAPTIGADVSDPAAKTDKFRLRARDLAAQYTAIVGVTEKRTTSAGAVAQMRGTDSRGRERLFHASRYR